MTINVTYGDNLNLDFDALPEVSRAALAQRGFSHIMGNEVAARVHAWAQAEGQANSDDRATVKAWKDTNAAAVTAKAGEIQADFVKALNDGTLGVRTVGPRLTPLETLMRQIARKEIENILRTNKIAVPKGEATVKMPNGEFTMAQLIERRLENETTGAAIKANAEKELRARAKALAGIEADAESALAGL